MTGARRRAAWVRTQDATDGVGVSGLVAGLVNAGEVWGYGGTWTKKEAPGQNPTW